MQTSKRIGQRYQKNDRVLKKTISKSRSLPPRTGTVLEVISETNKRGHTIYYYSIQWDDLKSPSIHAQHVLLNVN